MGLETNDPKIQALASLLRARDALEVEIADLIGRPASRGHIGEYIASRVFDIDLAVSAVNPGHDGIFRSGPLAGRTVNVKFYAVDDGLLDISPLAADYYLVLRGPKGGGSRSVRAHPTRIVSVYLFSSDRLLEAVHATGVRVGVATSVRRTHWDAARIYPPHDAAPLSLSEAQLASLRSFAPKD